MHTLSTLSKRFGVKRATLEYALKRDAVEPSGRVGITRVWLENDLPAIETAIQRSAENRRGPAAKPPGDAGRKA